MITLARELSATPPKISWTPSLGDTTPAGSETLALYGQRLPTNRGNSYLWGVGLNSTGFAETLQGVPSFDCRNTGGDHGPVDSDSPSAIPGCVTQPHPTVQGTGQGAVAHLQPEDYRGRR